MINTGKCSHVTLKMLISMLCIAPWPVNLQKGYVKKNLQQRLDDQYEQGNKSDLDERKHLGLFTKMTKHKKYEKSSYLDIIKTPSVRHTFSIIRLNCSKMSPSPYKEITIKCRNCDKLLNWQHCLLECPINRGKVDEYIAKTKPIWTVLVNLPLEEKVNRIMNLNFPRLKEQDQHSIISLTIAFVCRTYKSFLSGAWNIS